MNKDQIKLSKEEIVRHYEQYELSEVFNQDRQVEEKIKKGKNKFSLLYFCLSAGVAAGFLTLLSKK